MNILVLVKEVPDMAKVTFDSTKGVVNRASASAEINPFDVYALQTAVNIKKMADAQPGATPSTITAITMGPPRAQHTLRECFARGADQCLLLTDRKFGGADTLATSMTLSAAIQKLHHFHLILCGDKSVDGDTAQVGAEVAELLNIPHSYYVETIHKLTDTAITVTLENIGGLKQQREMAFPALLSVTKNITCPELPALKRLLQSLDIEISTLHLADLEGYLTEQEAGLSGSPTKVSKILIPPPAVKQNVIFREDYASFEAVFLEAAGAVC